MVRDLHSLIRLAKWGVDERQRELARLYDKEEAVLGQIDALKAELAREQTVVRDHPEFADGYAAFYEGYRQRRANLETTLRQVRHLILEGRDALADAYQDLKTYEVSQENRDAEENAERDRQEQMRLDEIGLTLFERRKRAAVRGR